MFAHVVETERRFYLTNSVQMDVKNEGARLLRAQPAGRVGVGHVSTARFVQRAVVTFKDVNVEELAGKDL
jgi:hypothetical protein